MPPLFVNIASLGKRIFQSAAPVVREIPQETVNLGKKVVAQGYKGFSPTAPVPETFGQALNEGLSLRKQQTIDQFSYDRANPQKGIGETAMNFAGGTTPQKVAGKAAERVFKGFNDLSAKTLEKLKGKTIVSRQFIEDMTNMPELKQAERDLVRGILAETKDQNINVPDFANRVKSELLPLERRGPNKAVTSFDGGTGPKYENITLPSELRGPVANYSEHVYESPIGTSAGEAHFADKGYGDKTAFPNYFAHTRVEDLPKNPNSPSIMDVINEGKATNAEEAARYIDKNFGEGGSTRRVIEIQSDLFQKGGMERHVNQANELVTYRGREYQFISDLGGGKVELLATTARSANAAPKYIRVSKDKVEIPSTTEYAKLEPYRNIWHERIIREEIKQAAKDGKTKLQFPTGETAMKIEGLGSQSSWNREVGVNLKLRPQDIKVGKIIGTGIGNDPWMIVKDLGNGKFRAIDRTNFPSISENPAQWDEVAKRDIENYGEDFDISGKVDTENPIYRFYEKTVGKYLANKYGAKRVKDAQGVEWWELGVDKKHKSTPIEAFGVAPLPFLPQDDDKRRFKSKPVDRESLFINKE